MARADAGECDAQSLKRLLNDTAAACQKCLLAVDSVVTSQQNPPAPSVVQTSVSCDLQVNSSSSLVQPSTSAASSDY